MGGRDDEGFYSNAGPGGKRRAANDRAAANREAREQRDRAREQRLDFNSERPKREAPETTNDDDDTPIRPVPIKARISDLTLQDLSLNDIIDTLKREGRQLSEIGISGVRRDFRDALRFLMKEGVIDEDALERWRRRKRKARVRGEG